MNTYFKDTINFLTKEMNGLATKEIIKKSMIAGIEAFAWYKDGVQYVGTCGTTFKEAKEEIESL